MQIYRGFEPSSSPEILGGTLGKVWEGMWAKPKAEQTQDEKSPGSLHRIWAV